MATEKSLTKKLKETGGSGGTTVKAPTIKPKVATGVTVVHGPIMETYDLSGVTVTDAVDMLKGPLGFDPNVNPLVNGEEADGGLVLSDGDTLEFVRGAGEKGNKIIVDKVHSTYQRVDGSTAWKVSNRRLVTRLFGGQREKPGELLHPFTRLHERLQGGRELTVLELPPHCRTVRWVSGSHDRQGGDGSQPDGDQPTGTKYESRFLSFPWIVIIYTTDGPSFTQAQELFYRNEPMRPGDTELLHSNMCNVARGHGWKAWLCFQNIRPTGDTQYVLANDAIHHTLDASFNRSSEIHEGNSGWNRKMRALDPRVASLSLWEKASKREPGFILKVPWPSAGTSIGEELNAFRTQAEGEEADLFRKLYAAGSRLSRR